MRNVPSQIIATLFGLSVIGSGLMRYFERPAGEKGLWFGIVMGALAIIAAFLFSVRRRIFGTILIWTSILFVGGWFVYEALIKKGFSQAEPRMLVIIAITAFVALFFVREWFASSFNERQASSKHQE